MNNIENIKVIDFLDSIKATDDSIQDYDVVGIKVDTMGQIFEGRKSPFTDYMETGDELRVKSQDRKNTVTYTIEIDGQEKLLSNKTTISVSVYPNSIVTNINNALRTLTVARGTTGTELISELESTDGSIQGYEIVNEKVSLEEGNILAVTAADGKAKENYTIKVEESKSSEAEIKSTNAEIVKEIGAIQSGSPLTARILVARDITVENLIGAVTSVDESKQGYKVIDTDKNVMNDTDSIRVAGTPNWLVVTSEDGKTEVLYSIELQIKQKVQELKKI